MLYIKKKVIYLLLSLFVAIPQCQSIELDGDDMFIIHGADQLVYFIQNCTRGDFRKVDLPLTLFSP